MNYIELGLPHTNLAPRLTASPRPLLPVSGLSRKYLGMEELSKTEIDSLIDRLSKPKDRSKPEVSDTNTGSEEVQKKVRFTGKKKMTKSDINSMIERLSKGASKPSDLNVNQRVKTAETRKKAGYTAWQGYVKYKNSRPVTV